MKRTLAIVLLAALSLGAAAQSNVLLKREGELLNARFDIDTRSLPLKAGTSWLLVPEITDGDHTRSFEPVGLFSRERYIHYQRTGRQPGGADTRVYKKGNVPAVLSYDAFVPYEEWMDGAELRLRTVKYGCCDGARTVAEDILGRYQLEDIYPSQDQQNKKGLVQ